LIIRESDVEAGIHIDFVPMVDVLFNLLIFFLLATTIAQVEREMQIALPFAESAGPISASLKEVVINVDGSGRIFISGSEVTPEQLREIVSQAVAGNPEQKVTVRGDRNTAYANIVNVLDVCKGCGVQEPYLDTVLTN
jgi:biopolymer transport protein ExbD